MDLRLKHYKLMVSNLGNNRTPCQHSSVSASISSKPTSYPCHSLSLLPISLYVHVVKDSPLYYTEKTEATFTPPIPNPLALHPHHDYRAFQLETSLWFKDSLSAFTQTLLQDSSGALLWPQSLQHPPVDIVTKEILDSLVSTHSSPLDFHQPS